MQDHSRENVEPWKTAAHRTISILDTTDLGENRGLERRNGLPRSLERFLTHATAGMKRVDHSTDELLGTTDSCRSRPPSGHGLVATSSTKRYAFLDGRLPNTCLVRTTPHLELVHCRSRSFAQHNIAQLLHSCNVCRNRFLHVQ